ncbi:MAG: ImmA/IrrE family metallo-endopeptidase [Ruthenibacterium sp.]
MTTTELYQYAAQHDVQVYFFPLPETGSLSLPMGEVCCIGIDSAPMTQSEEGVRLAHELGHCRYAGFYSRSAPYEVRERIEHKAEVWQIRKQVPLTELRAALRDGCTELWQLAEQFELPEKEMEKALFYYKETLGVAL